MDPKSNGGIFQLQNLCIAKWEPDPSGRGVNWIDSRSCLGSASCGLGKGLFFNALHHSQSRISHLYTFKSERAIKNPNVWVEKKSLWSATNGFLSMAQWVRFGLLGWKRESLFVDMPHYGHQGQPMTNSSSFSLCLHFCLEIQVTCAFPSRWKYPESPKQESLTRSSAGWARTPTPEWSSSSPTRTTSGERRSKANASPPG